MRCQYVGYVFFSVETAVYPICVCIFFCSVPTLLASFLPRIAYDIELGVSFSERMFSVCPLKIQFETDAIVGEIQSSANEKPGSNQRFMDEKQMPTEENIIIEITKKDGAPRTSGRLGGRGTFRTTRSNGRNDFIRILLQFNKHYRIALTKRTSRSSGALDILRIETPTGSFGRTRNTTTPRKLTDTLASVLDHLFFIGAGSRAYMRYKEYDRLDPIQQFRKGLYKSMHLSQHKVNSGPAG
ncbi:hypothetical protein T4A_10183 [Trichinella pseudospiralis]|uniref:Uncharacterized protein n=1 Tax=Trichinella pseudospiralis TaxID=6337 RepID=A0A0V1EST0_TRIPS|nr:hypothetical protein T4A_10183 [Trichinella pseudospiralis]